MNGGEDHDEVSLFDGLAGTADCVMEFLERFSSRDHIHYIDAHFHDELLRHDDVEA